MRSQRIVLTAPP